MTTELLLRHGVASWDDVHESLTSAISQVVEGIALEFEARCGDSAHHVSGKQLVDGSLRLTAAGNDSLPSASQLTVRDERAVIAVGFSVKSADWGSFCWDWSAPLDEVAVASGVIRTMRDIYKVQPSDLDVSITL
ncbi:MAG: hypothetical protein HKN94_15340 [Acidimicrobiales bacterium]|nr:hypothetical protein [Acidimicrobiales bacterium]RZV42031.1 MAG: hypothetical protein EX269_15475 [Acidimicrobiales bacterium]